MSTDPQRLWYDLVRRLGREPEPRTLGPEEAWAEYLAAPHLPAPPDLPGRAMPPVTDDSGLLVEQVRCGVDAALREILRRYRPMLVAQIRACLLGVPKRGLDAEELLNAAVTRILQKIGGLEYRGEASFRNWISTQVMVEVQNRLSRADDPSTRGSLEPRHDGPGTQQAELLAQIGRLEAEDRDLIAMRYFEQLSFDDISKKLQCSEGTARKRLERAIARLASAVGRRRVPGPDGHGHRIPDQAFVSLLSAYEKQALMNALSITGGNKVAAARLLHMGKGAFYRKLQSHGLTEGRNDP